MARRETGLMLLLLTIQVCYTTQAIVDNGDIVTNAKKEIEKVVYEVLEL